MKKLIMATALIAASMTATAFASTNNLSENNNTVVKKYIISGQDTYNNLCDIIKPVETTTKNCFEVTTQIVIKPDCTTEVTTQAKPTTEATTEVTTQTRPTTEATTEVTTQVRPTTEATTEVTTQARPTTEATTEVTTQARPTTEATTEVTTQAKPTTEATTEVTTQAKPTTEATTESTTADTNNSIAKSLLALVNQARAENGLSALSLNDSLSAVAQKKAEDMKNNNYFSHTSPTYGSPFDMIKNAGISYKSAGENIAMGQKTAEAVFNAWMNSSGHRANILSSKFTQMGIGVTDGSTRYWSQMFIG